MSRNLGNIRLNLFICYLFFVNIKILITINIVNKLMKEINNEDIIIMFLTISTLNKISFFKKINKKMLITLKIVCNIDFI